MVPTANKVWTIKVRVNNDINSIGILAYKKRSQIHGHC